MFLPKVGKFHKYAAFFSKPNITKGGEEVLKCANKAQERLNSAL